MRRRPRHGEDCVAVVWGALKWWEVERLCVGELMASLLGPAVEYASLHGFKSC